MSDILKGLEISTTQENINEIDNDPDRNALHKKYILKLEELSFKFRVWTHPFKLLQAMLILSSITFLAYIFRNISYINDAYEILYTLLGYIATFVFSSIFTWFLENYGKNHKNDDM